MVFRAIQGKNRRLRADRMDNANDTTLTNSFAVLDEFSPESSDLVQAQV